MISTVAHYRLPAEGRAEILARLLEVARCTRAEPGLCYFHLLQEDDDPANLILVEGWADDSALASHQASVHFQETLVGELVPMLVSRQVTRARPVYADEFA